MKQTILFLITFITFTVSHADDKVIYTEKHNNFDGSVTYDNPRAAFAGYWLRPSEVYKAQHIEYLHSYGSMVCTDYSLKVSKTSLNLCNVLGHSKLVGSVNEDFQDSEYDYLFVTTQSRETGILSSIEEYQTEYSVYGKNSIGYSVVQQCEYGASKVIQITCK